MERIAVKQFLPQDFDTAEAIKTLRTNLIFRTEALRAVALTSYEEGEGTSALAFQLAAALAQTGKRVLLMDADLRKGALAKQLKVGRKVDGLSHYLSGMANLEDVICETDLPRFFVMFAGMTAANPAEVLGSMRFQKLVTALKGTFDYTILDTAPLGQVIDCAVLAPEMDGVLIVIDVTHNAYPLERRMIQQLEKSGGKVLGAVLNRVDLKGKRHMNR